LIRSHTDRGVVAILDTRLRTKQYGRTTVLDSLPFDAPVSTTGKLHDIFSSFAVKEPLPDLTKRVAFNEHDVNNFLEEIYAVDEAFEVVF
jgi:hypothetical protein